MTVFKLDDENENWLVERRAKKLKQRGWDGTIAEWIEAIELLEEDPLDRKPKITSLAAAKKAKK